MTRRTSIIVYTRHNYLSIPWWSSTWKTLMYRAVRKARTWPEYPTFTTRQLSPRIYREAMVEITLTWEESQ